MTLDRITSDPNRMNGQPCIRHLRLTVRRVLELIAKYPDRQELFQEFPELEEEARCLRIDLRTPFGKTENCEMYPLL